MPSGTRHTQPRRRKTAQHMKSSQPGAAGCFGSPRRPARSSTGVFHGREQCRPSATVLPVTSPGADHVANSRAGCQERKDPSLE
jgi:hypothetical protein